MIEVKVVKHCYVCPPKGSVPTTNVPLSFLDMYWITCPTARRFFFYNFPHSTQHFIDNLFPTLQQSLSLTLQHFFPLAGNLILPSQPNHKPYILYTSDDGRDDLPQLIIAIAEPSSNQFERDYFDILVADYPQTRDAKEFYPLVPDLPKSRVLPDGARAFPLLAIQITLFPNQGLCICVAFHHAVADGKAAHHFIKSWATASNSTSTPTSALSLPNHDRTTVKHLNGSNIDSIFLRALSSWLSFPIIEKPIIHIAPLNTNRATFVLTKTQIQKLKALVTSSSSSLRVSGFIVTCSLIWSCMIKSSITITHENNDHDEIFYLLFVGDCRNRLKEPLPPTYFGNCLDICIVELKKKELLKEDSIVGVVEAIGNKVKELEKEPLKIVEKWFSEWRRCDETKRLITVAGSPKLRVYDTDFGWGRPCKSEVLHVDNSKAISLQESRDDKGGIEISLGLTQNRMDCFISIWERSLKLFCN